MNGTIYMPVGEVCSSISDTYREKKNMVTLINTSDVLEGRVLNHERVPNSNLKGQFKKTFQRDDILYSEIRPQNRRFAYVDFSPIDYIASTKLMVIRAKKDVVSPKYLYYFLKNSSTVAELQLLAETRSGTFPQITFSEVANLTIPVPSLAVQEVIVQTMQCLEDKITCNEQINDNLEQQAQAIYHERFETVSPNDLPSDWRIVTLGEVATISNKSFNPLKEPEILLEHYSIPAFDEARFPVFELSTSIKSNKFIIDASCFMISKLNPTTKRVWKPYCLTGNAVCSTEFIVYKEKCRDFMNNTTIDIVNSMLESPDIHHIFPEAYCEKMGIKRERYNSIINKTPILPATNRSIGGNAPSEYLGAILKKVDGLNEDELQARVESHFIDYSELKADNFNGYFIDRAKSLLNLIEKAMNKPVTDRDAENTLDQFGASLA